MEINIILSPKQAQSFRDRINADGTDAHAIDEALAHVHSENAEASVQADLEAIRALIQQDSGGFGILSRSCALMFVPTRFPHHPVRFA